MPGEHIAASQQGRASRTSTPRLRGARDIGARVVTLTHASDFRWVAELLSIKRDEILDRWLAATASQPFHAGRREHAVANHIPKLFDALIGRLEREAPREIDASPPLDDPGVLAQAQAHARTRVRQGLAAADILMEFRLLRQEIGRALRLHLPDNSPTRDVVGAELVLHDALDGAVFLALATLAAHEAEQQRLQEQRQVLDKEREAFVLTIAHDLKNPLTAIKGTVQVLQRQIEREGVVPAPRLSTRLALMDDAASRATARLDELVDVMRSRDGTVLELQRQPVDLVDLVRGAAAVLQHGTEIHRIDVSSTTPEIVGEWDRPRLERVVDNLIGNAVKYSPQGGTVRVRLRQEDGAAVLVVSDAGLGIPGRDLPHVFERFWRAGNVGRIAGTGIGLAAVRQIVEQHGGTIHVESAEGQGSTFTVRLPLRAALPDQPSSTHHGPDDTAPPRGASGRSSLAGSGGRAGRGNRALRDAAARGGRAGGGGGVGAGPDTGGRASAAYRGMPGAGRAGR